MNTIHHRLHCAMHTDARADYTFRIYVYMRLRLRHTYLSDTKRDEAARRARWLKSFAFHFAGLRARKVTRDLNDSPKLASLRRIVKLRALTPKTCLSRGGSQTTVWWGPRALFAKKIKLRQLRNLIQEKLSNVPRMRGIRVKNVIFLLILNTLPS